MSLNEAVFGANSTLWDVLDTENIPSLTQDLTRLEEQVQTLGRTVDNNFIVLNDRVTTLDTKVDGLDQELNEFNLELISLNLQVDSLQNTVDELDPDAIITRFQTIETQISDINQQVDDVEMEVNTLSALVMAVETKVDTLEDTTNLINSQISGINSILQSLTNRVVTLEANSLRNTILTGGNEYVWYFRINTNTYSRRITFNVPLTEVITANVFRSASILDSQTGTAYTRNTRLMAAFDSFRTAGIIPYAMLLGECLMQFQGDTATGPRGYMSLA